MIIAVDGVESLHGTTSQLQLKPCKMDGVAKPALAGEVLLPWSNSGGAHATAHPQQAIRRLLFCVRCGLVVRRCCHGPLLLQHTGGHLSSGGT